MLPGVAAHRRRVHNPTVVVMGFSDGKVAYEHIYWDQASVLVQLGLLDPAGLPDQRLRAGRATARSRPVR